MEIEPLKLEPTPDGRWAAHGDGWAVYGAKREEALATYRGLVERRREPLAPRRRKGSGARREPRSAR
jgi:hypothetical protein